MTALVLGVLGRSFKENERRLPLHPAHLHRIPAEIRDDVLLEHGYGERFGVSDADLRPWVAGFRTREELFGDCDVLLQPKPMLSDVAGMRVGQVLWGWPHCVQDEKLTQLAIDKRLTVIAFEAMNHWNADGSFGLHVFHKNNELAGYCSVMHAMQLAGVTGDFGQRPTAVVIGFGATGRGAVAMLNALGVHDVDVLTHRAVAAVAAPIHSVRMVHFDTDAIGQASHAVTPGGVIPISEFVARHDIIVNCVLQDTDHPLMLLTDEDVASLHPGSLIVDVSCDTGMGFPWARPTTFDDPISIVGKGVMYYAVDHSPSHLWNAATWEISEALLPFLATVVAGARAGTSTRPFTGRLRSWTARSRIPPSCPSKPDRRAIPTRRGSLVRRPTRGHRGSDRPGACRREGERPPAARVHPHAGLPPTPGTRRERASENAGVRSGGPACGPLVPADGSPLVSRRSEY